MLDNKTVLITGATGGIGSSIAKLLSQKKCNLILHYNNDTEKALKLKEELEQLTNVLIVQADLSKEEEINKMVDESLKKFSKIDILVNNAATVQDEALSDKTKETFMHTLDVNLVAPFLLTKLIGRNMLENKSGKIINISSTNGIDTVYPESIDYDASKAGLINMTKNFAIYYAPYIQVNAIAPGWVNTRMNDTLDEEYKKEEVEKILLKRFAQPNEIAEVVLFLCQNDYINGTTIRIDGGLK